MTAQPLTLEFYENPRKPRRKARKGLRGSRRKRKRGHPKGAGRARRNPLLTIVANPVEAVKAVSAVLKKMPANRQELIRKTGFLPLQVSNALSVLRSTGQLQSAGRGKKKSFFLPSKQPQKSRSVTAMRRKRKARKRRTRSYATTRRTTTRGPGRWGTRKWTRRSRTIANPLQVRRLADFFSAKVWIPALAGAGGLMAAFAVPRFISRVAPQTTATVLAQRMTNYAGIAAAALGSFMLARGMKMPALNWAGVGAIIAAGLQGASDIGVISFAPPVVTAGMFAQRAAGVPPVGMPPEGELTANAGASGIVFDEEDVDAVSGAFGTL